MKNIKPISKIRHWKQRFNPDARMVLRRDMTFATGKFQKGEEVPDIIYQDKGLMKRLWRLGRIELMFFGNYVEEVKEPVKEKTVKKKAVKKIKDVVKETD